MTLSRTASAMTWRDFKHRRPSPTPPSLTIVILSTFASFIVSSLADSSKISFSLSPVARDYIEKEKINYVSINSTNPPVACSYGSCSQICVRNTRKCRCHKNYELQEKSRHGVCEPKNYKGDGFLLSVTDKHLLLQDPSTSVASVLIKGHFEKYHRSIRSDLLNRMAFDVRSRKLYYWLAHDGPQRVVEIDLKADKTMKNIEPRDLFFPDLHDVTGFAVDWMTHNFYFTDAWKRTVTVCKRDGRCIDLIRFKRYTPYDIIIDVVNSKLYWVGQHDSGTSSIERSELDGSSLFTLCITHKYQIRSLAVDPFQTVVPTPDVDPFNVDVNQNSKNFSPRTPGQIYFVCKQGSSRVIMTIDSAGTGAKRLKSFRSSTEIRSLSIRGEDLLAIANSGPKGSSGIKHGNLLRINRFVKEPKPHVVTAVEANLVALHYFHPASTPQLGEDPCEPSLFSAFPKPSLCAHICIARFQFIPARRQCICREGYVLGKDGSSCNREDPLLLAFTDSVMIFFPHATYGAANLPYNARPDASSHKTRSVLSLWWSEKIVSGLVDITSLAIHRKWNLMYYADDAKDYIGVAHVEDSHWTKNELKQNLSMKNILIDFTMPVKTGNMYTVKALTVDWISDSLYWLEGSLLSPGVWISQLDGSNPIQIIGKNHLFKPSSIAIHPAAGLLFLADAVGGGFIDKCRMDGTRCFPLVVQTESPNNLVVDVKGNLLYWTSVKGSAVKQSCINVITFLGTQQRTILEGITYPPTSLTLQNGRLFWTDTQRTFINAIGVDGKTTETFHDIKGRKMSAVLGMDIYQDELSNACSEYNGNCSHYCVSLPGSSRVCLCPDGMQASGSTCVEKKCEENRFKCGNGKCIPNQLVCDSYRDCVTGEDEQNCTSKCQGSFTCKSGECLLGKNDRCDGFKDCRDGSDEEDCGEVQCPKGFHRCKNNECILDNFWCDRDFDCSDQSDEASCDYPPIECVKDQYYCPSLNMCHNNAWICDGENDCRNSKKNIYDDEVNCTSLKTVCKMGEWRCNPKSKTCVEVSQVCDGQKDCPEGEDESPSTCKSHEWQGCAHNEFTCEKGKCISKSKECDRIVDCANGLDEVHCNYQKCGDDEFFCNEKCWKNDYLCDGIEQCSDGQDESNCTRTHFHGDCLKNQFECDSGRQCILLSQVCDKFADCADHSDEGGRCQDACYSNGGCEKFCRATPIGPYCSCPSGFRLDSSGRKCVDVDECAEDVYKCSQICTNRKGSFDCSCVDGYLSSSVAHHSGKQGYMAEAKSEIHHFHHSYFCKAAVGKPRLLIAQADKLFMISNIGADLAVDHHETYYASAYTTYDFHEEADKLTPFFDYDIRKEELIWGYQSKGSMSKIRISEYTFLVSFNLSCIAYDWITQNLYVGDSATQSIGLVSRKPVIKTYANLVTGVDIARCIALDVRSGHMYWGQFDERGDHGGIFRATMDGKNSKKLTNHFAAKRVSSITIDFARNRLVYIDKWLGIVSWLPLDSETAKPVELVRMMHFGPTQIDTFEDSLYFLNDLFHRVSQVDILHHDEVVSLHQFSWLAEPPHDIKVIHPYRQPNRSNPCASMPCAQFCVLAPSNSARSSSSQGFACLGDDVNGKSGDSRETKDNSSFPALPPFSATKATIPIPKSTAILTTASTTTTTIIPATTTSTTTSPTTTSTTSTSTTTSPTTTSTTSTLAKTTSPSTTVAITTTAITTSATTTTNQKSIIKLTEKPEISATTLIMTTTTARGCSGAPCRNGGSCVRNFFTNYRCICRFGYYGSQCERQHSIRNDDEVTTKSASAAAIKRSTTTSTTTALTTTTTSATTTIITSTPATKAVDTVPVSTSTMASSTVENVEVTSKAEAESKPSTTESSNSVILIGNDKHKRTKSRKGIGFPSTGEGNWSIHDQELDAHDIILQPGNVESAKSSSALEPAAIAAIILAMVIFMVVIAIFIYVRKYKRDFLENQVIVRFRRPNAEAFENEDSIQVNDFSRSVDATIIEDEDVDDDNNNNGKTEVVNADASKEEASDETEAGDFKTTPSGESRFKKMVGGCKEKFKISRKKNDSMTVPLDTTVPLDDTLIEDQTWHSSIRDVHIRQASHSPAVLAISSRTEFDSPTIQPVNPPRTILKIFGESAEAANDGIRPGSYSGNYSELLRSRSQVIDNNVLFPYLTPTPSESEDDCGSIQDDSSEGPDENRLLM